VLWHVGENILFGKGRGVHCVVCELHWYGNGGAQLFSLTIAVESIQGFGQGGRENVGYRPGNIVCRIILLVSASNRPLAHEPPRDFLIHYTAVLESIL
jgi:hypothetical protein